MTIGVAPAAAALLALVAAFFGLAAKLVGAWLNRLDRSHRPRPSVSPATRRFHDSLRIADLHDDVLLWDRDPLRRSRHGHTDLPRLREGGVAVEIFSTVTKVPWGSNYLRNPAETDSLTWLVIGSRWPTRSWRHPFQRALHQARRLREAAARSGGRLVLVTSGAGLAAALEARACQPPGERAVIGLLSTEGLHALESRREHVDALFGHGFRCAGLAHFADNDVAGSAHGVAQGGLSELGRAVVRRMEELRMIVDLAHASARTVDEVLAMATRPVLVSHSGVQGVCPGPRNLSDDQLRRIAARGGMVGVGLWREAVGDISPHGVARSIRHAVAVAGPEHVGLGSDWDGAVTVGLGAAHLAELTQALLDEGLSEQLVRAVMGENALRFLLENLP